MNANTCGAIRQQFFVIAKFPSLALVAQDAEY